MKKKEIRYDDTDEFWYEDDGCAYRLLHSYDTEDGHFDVVANESYGIVEVRAKYNEEYEKRMSEELEKILPTIYSL